MAAAVQLSGLIPDGHGAPLHVDVLLAQRHLLGHRGLDNVGAHPHPAALDVALADPNLLLNDRDDLLSTSAGGGGRCSG